MIRATAMLCLRRVETAILLALCFATELPTGEAATPADAAPAQRQGVVRMVFVGDVMLDGGPGHVISNGGDPFAEVASLLQDADLAVANLECAIAEKGKAVEKGYNFLALPNCLPVLKRHFSAVSVANNHSGDYGKDGFLSHLEALEGAKLPYFGGGRNEKDARRPLLLTRNGRRIALLAYNDFPPRSFAAGPNTPGIAWLVEADMLADIKAARAEQHADLVIPYLHWGREETPSPAEEQRQLARKLIDAGADAVIGSHPHVTQTVETYRGRPIIYSLGNFVFDYFPKDPPVWIGWIVQLTFGEPTGVEMKTWSVELDAAGVPHLTPKGEPSVSESRQKLRSLARKPFVPKEEDVERITAEVYQFGHPLALPDLGPFELPREDYSKILDFFRHKVKPDEDASPDDPEMGTIQVILKGSTAVRLTWYFMGQGSRISFACGGVRYTTVGKRSSADECTYVDSLVRQIHKRLTEGTENKEGKEVSELKNGS